MPHKSDSKVPNLPSRTTRQAHTTSQVDDEMHQHVARAPISPQGLVVPPQTLNASGVIGLQRSIGNRAVQRMFAPKRSGTGAGGTIQRYVTASELAKPSKKELQENVGAEAVALEAQKLHPNTRISDNRNVVVMLGDAAAEGSQQLYADNSLVGPAQTALDKVGNSGSPINLTVGATQDFFGKNLAQIVPQFKDVGGFGELKKYSGQEGAEVYKEETEAMTTPLSSLKDQVSEGQLSWPTGDRGTEIKVKAINTFRDLLGEKKFELLKTEKVALEQDVVNQIAERLQSRISEIQRLRGNANDAKLILHKECIKAAHTVMGVTLGGNDRAIYKDDKGNEKETAPEGRGDQGIQSLTKSIFELLEQSFGTEGIESLVKPHNELDQNEQKQRRELEMKSGINAGANPMIGEAYGTVAHTWDENFKKNPNATGNWNMHWAAVVMKDGGDNVTLENAADGPIDMDKSWWFQMFGTEKPGQTFHEQMVESGFFGNLTTTLRVKAEKDEQALNIKRFDSGKYEGEAASLLPTIEKRKNEYDGKAPLPLKSLTGQLLEERLTVALAYAKTHLEPKVRTAKKERLAAWIKSVQDYIDSDPAKSPIGRLNPTGTQFNLDFARYVVSQLRKVKPG